MCNIIAFRRRSDPDRGLSSSHSTSRDAGGNGGGAGRKYFEPHRRYLWPFWFASLNCDVIAKEVTQESFPNAVERVLPKGTLVRITYANRKGELGIIDDLSRSCGYIAKVTADMIQSASHLN